jgi:single-strand DNA-binding protein
MSCQRADDGPWQSGCAHVSSTTSEATMGEGLNRVMLLGNLGQDPTLRFTQSGQAVLSLRLATNESFLNKEGERQERTEWHSVTVWGKRAEGLNKVISKGTQLFVEGRLQTRSWDDKQGQKRYSTEVVANNVILVGSRGGGGGGHDGPPPPSDDDMQGGGGGGAGGGDDDIPF